jgi:HEAT repeat protein
LLKAGQLARVSAQVAHSRDALLALLRLLGDPDTELTVRIGINAVFEGLEGDPLLAETIAPLTELLAHRDAHVRGDAAHLLSHTHRPEARPLLDRLLHDENADVREIAREGLERLDAGA